MSGLPSNPSKSFIARNPKIYDGASLDTKPKGDRVSIKRIRQDSRPLLNKLETQWSMVLKSRYPDAYIHAQQWRVKLANGAWFKVDFCVFSNGIWTAWECKGPKQGKNVDRGMLALKCAVSAFPEVNWILVWKEDGVWREQVLLP